MAQIASVNLIPQSVVFVHARRRHVKRWAGVFAVSLAIALSGIGVNWLQRAEATQLEEESRRVHAELVSIRITADAAEVEAQVIENRLNRADALRAKRSWSGMLALVAKSLPLSCWLTAVATDPPFPSGSMNMVTAKFNGSKKRKKTLGPIMIESPRKLRLVGFASTVADPHRFVINLNATNVFESVVLTGTQQQQLGNGEFYRFEIECEW